MLSLFISVSRLLSALRIDRTTHRVGELNAVCCRDQIGNIIQEVRDAAFTNTSFLAHARRRGTSARWGVETYPVWRFGNKLHVEGTLARRDECNLWRLPGPQVQEAVQLLFVVS